MKKFIRIAVAALLIAVVPHSAKAQSKVAHFSLDSILNIMPEMKRASDSAAIYYKSLENQMYSMQMELERKGREYDSLKTKWSPLIVSLKEKEISDLQYNIQVFQQQAQTDYANYRAKLVEPIFKKIKDAVKAVALEKKYTYVIDSSDATGVVLYANPGDDIFKDVCLKLGIPLPAPKPATGGTTTPK